MKLVIFGLTITSSWGNGHATLWRGLCNALSRQEHEITFFERDVPYYARHRDLQLPQPYRVRLYPSWNEVQSEAESEVRGCDAVIITSYCPDAQLAADLVTKSRAIKVFYDLDTAVTLANLRAQGSVSYIPRGGLHRFDLVLSYVGGSALRDLKETLDAPAKTAPLYGSVDSEMYQPIAKSSQYESDLSYLGTYANDRQAMLCELFLQTARRLPGKRFLVGGAQYPDDFPWGENIWFVRHVPPRNHPAFYCSSRATLNVTRAAMASVGYCPSGRLFEAAACATPIITDSWEGLSEFFEPEREVLIARSADDVVRALSREPEELRRIGLAARKRVLREHTAEHRSQELVRMLEAA